MLQKNLRLPRQLHQNLRPKVERSGTLPLSNWNYEN
jgi:hypothetical protein